MPGRAAVALNMIVRNESAIIERCLASATPHIDYWVILDTGSTDKTTAMIQRHFSQAGIPGELYHAEFVDFGYSRNQALDLCRESHGHFDYILLMDADMELVVTEPNWRQQLDAPCYRVRQFNQLAYDNLRLVARNQPARYRGPTHEYLECQGDGERLGSIHFIDHACGANRADKFERDVRLLRQALESDPGNPRHVFYLAQSLKDAGHTEDALACYQQRAGMGGWDEETWYAAYQAALCLRMLERYPEFESAIESCWRQRPWRAEPLAALADHFLAQHQHGDAMDTAMRGLSISFPEQDRLFIERSVYQWHFTEILSIAGYYLPSPAHKALGGEGCQQLSVDPSVPSTNRQQARNNLAWYAHEADDWLGMQALPSLALPGAPGWFNLNPSVCIDDGQRAVIVRHCNYEIIDGRYQVLDPDGVIRTKNFLAGLDEKFHWNHVRPISRASRTGQGSHLPRHDFPVKGHEDCRLFRWRQSWWATATCRDTTPDGRCEQVLLQLADDGQVIDEVALRGPWSADHQKNWMPLVDGEELYFVHSLAPLVILRYDSNARRALPWRESWPPLALDHLRGGTSLLRISQGWLGLCHETAMTPGSQRHYLHRFFLLDDELLLTALSPCFRFQGQSIEFAAGLALEGQQLVISYGICDREARMGKVALARVLERLEPVNPPSRVSG